MGGGGWGGGGAPCGFRMFYGFFVVLNSAQRREVVSTMVLGELDLQFLRNLSMSLMTLSLNA